MIGRRRLGTVFCILLWVCAAAGEPVGVLLDALRAPDAERREAALAELGARVFSAEEGALLLEAAGGEFPAGDATAWRSVNAEILRALARGPDPGWVAKVEALRPALAGKEGAGAAACGLLAAIRTPEALAALGRALADPAPSGEDAVSALPALAAASALPPAALAELWTRLPSAAPGRLGLLDFLLAICDRGAARLDDPPELAAGCRARASDLAERHATEIEAARPALDLELAPAACAALPAEGIRVGRELERLADLLRHAPGPETETVLRRLLALSPARLRIFAAGSLLALDHPVEETLLAELARRPGPRALLRKVLARRDRLARFPAAFATPEALAEADLAAWLESPTGAGATPEAIEFLEALDAAGTVRRYRFRLPGDPRWYEGFSGGDRTGSEMREAR